MAEQEQFMTIGAAARQLGVSEPTVRVWTRTGRLPELRASNGYRLFRVTDVRRVATEVRERREVVSQ